MKKLIFITLTIFSFLLFQAKSHALGFEASLENSISSARRGETAEFTILFWNSQNSSIPIQLRAKSVPDGMSVLIFPDYFLLNYSKVTKFPAERGKTYINTKQGLMKTFPVKVLVKVSKKVELGKYDVYIDAIAGKSSKGISTLLEKNFKLTVNVVSFKETTTSSIQERVNVTKNLWRRITGKFTTPSYLPIFLMIMVAIFVLSWIIYKYV